MNTEPAPNRCPQCGGTVPADAPQGLCPRCVLARAATPTETGAKPGSRLTPPPLAAVAAAFPQFEILELIGIGGMGVVYKARQPKLDRVVALKLLPQSPGADPAFAERFHREARCLARLTHPHIVSVFDFGESGGFCYLLMEFVDGVNLRQAMQAGRFSPAQALAIVPDICSALQYAHEQGVLHRDIKPENILLDAQGRVKIADFGIAKLVGDPGDSGTGLTLTQSGARLGTPHYMAPEQIEKPSDVDHRADIYSLGVVFYELLTGELPLGRFAAPSAKTPLDARVDEIVMRALAKERELRQQSAGEMKTQVETVAANPHGAPCAEAQASAPPGLLKVGTSTITTPERLATFAGQFFLYRTRGQLILDGRQLTHTHAETTTVIPLTAIRDLSIGHYPRVMNPVGIDFLSVTYGEGGQTKRLFLSPMDSIVGLPSRWNQRVAEWFHAIYNAVVAATGRPPGTTPAEKLGTPAGSKAVYGLFLLPIAIGVVFVSLALHSGPFHGAVNPPLTHRMGPLVAGSLGLLLACLVAFKASRRAPGPWSHRLKWLAIALIALPLSAYVASLVAPILHRGIFGDFGGIIAGLVPMTTGAALVWLFVRSRPSETSPDGKNSPRRRGWLGLAPLLVVIFAAVMPVLIWALRQAPQALKVPGRGSPDRPAPAWSAARMDVSATPSQGAATLRIAKVSNDGPLLLLEMVSEAGYPPHTLRVQFAGMPAAQEPVLPGNLQADCVLGPERRGADGQPLGVAFDGHVLAGTNLLKGPASFRIGFALPDPGLATMAAQQIQQLYGGRTLGLQAGTVTQLFNLQSRLGTDPQGRPVYQSLSGLLSLEGAAAPRSSSASPTSAVSETAALELQYAQNRLAEVKKQAEVGVVAPRGKEVLDAELAVAEAEGRLKGDPRIGAEARMNRAKLLLVIAQRQQEVGRATIAEVEAAQLELAKAQTALKALGSREQPDLKAGEFWPRAAGPQNLMRAFALGSQGEHVGALAALQRARAEVANAPTNRWVLRRDNSAYLFEGRLDQRITALMAQEASLARDAGTLHEVQLAGASLWPAGDEFELYSVWVDHFAPGRGDQDTDEVRVGTAALQGLQPGVPAPATVIHRHKEYGKPNSTNLITGDWLNSR
jgi:tRNA A-37 threonylcarbamoyl transferase component Bud32